MKDKLRELADRWKIYGSHMTGHECAEELLAILDAEGDGGAVPAGWVLRETNGGIVMKHARWGNYAVWSQVDKPFFEFLNDLIASQIHPARSGVVSEEDVSVVAKMIADRVGNGMREKYEGLAKQIAEHFTRRTP